MDHVVTDGVMTQHWVRASDVRMWRTPNGLTFTAWRSWCGKREGSFTGTGFTRRENILRRAFCKDCAAKHPIR